MVKQNLKRLNAVLRPRHLYYGPDWIVLGVNNLCNLHCRMCDVGTGYQGSNFYHHLMDARPLNMPLELIRRVIDQTALHYPNAKLGYAFTEPLIYPHLLESLQYAEDKGLFTSITTNALKLPKLAVPLAEAGLDELFVSLDGPEAIHNEIRGNKRSFEWAIDGMQKLFALPGRRPEVSVYCTITEWNTEHLLAFLEFFSGMPVKEIGFMHTNFTPGEVALAHNADYGNKYPATASNMEGIDIGKINLNQLLEEIQAIKARDWGFPVSFSPELDDRAALEIFYHQPEKCIGSVCNDAFRTIMVKSDGKVIPAHGRCYRVEAGNLYEQDLKTIWNARPLADFRQALMDAGGLLPACSRCCSAF